MMRPTLAISRPAAILAISVAAVITLAACDGRTGRIVGLTGPTTTADTNAVTTVTVSPSSATVAVGATSSFGAVARTASGRSVTATISWTSSNPVVATIDGSGIATGLATGTTTVTATSGKVSGQATLTVK